MHLVLGRDRLVKPSGVGSGGVPKGDHLVRSFASCVRAQQLVWSGLPVGRRRSGGGKRIRLGRAATPLSAHRHSPQGPRIPQFSTGDVLARRRTRPCFARRAAGDGGPIGPPYLGTVSCPHPRAQTDRGAMSSSPVARLLLPLLLCAGALGLLPRSHGAAAEAPGYVTVSAASFEPGSTCSAPDPGTRTLAA